LVLNSVVKRKLEAGEPAYGAFFKFASANLVEMIGLSGFDFIIIDAEHSNFTFGEIENMIRAAQLVGMSAIVRTPDASEANVLHALDSGASGVQVPSLRSAKEARDVVRYSKYHPFGERGWAPGCRAGDYAFTPAQTYIEQANRDTLIVVHVENSYMVDDIDALCDVEHLDVVFLGTGDLSQSLGHPGNAKHPDVLRAVDKVIDAATKRGKFIGAVASTPADLETFASRGVNYVAWQSDLVIYKNALKSAVEHFKPYRKPRTKD
jgi:4-hydroxy-2-oxoheptanedioate aldolase